MKSAALAIAGAALAAAQTVHFDIEKRNVQGLARRAFDATLQNNQQQGGYFITVKVGSPGQTLTLQLDTGSSDVWVPASTAKICTDTDSQNPGCTLGSFDPSKSETFDDIGKGLFDISYVDKSGSKGDYFLDDFQIGSVTLKNFTMGLGLDTTIAAGLIGVGYAANEASIETTQETYPNLPVALQASGDIKTIAYSLWLNDLDASTGSILFGGIDTEKYHGELTKLNLIHTTSRSNFTDFAVQVFSVTAVSDSGSDVMTTEETEFIAVLDSGTTLTYLPQDMAFQIWEELGAQWNDQAGQPIVPCKFANSAGYFSFGFGGSKGTTVNVTLDELITPITTGRPPVYEDGPFKGDTICGFGILNQTEAPYLLGDTFLRSAYVVYDLVNNQVAIAATDFNSTKSSVVPFPSDGAPIPSATLPSTVNETPATASAQGSLSASSGFQSGKGGNSGSSGNGGSGGSSGGSGSGSDSGAMSLAAFSNSGLVVVGLTLGYTVLGGAIFNYLL